MDNVAAARYLLAKKKDMKAIPGINQNYAWGQDSWRDFVGAMKVLAPKAEVDKELFPEAFRRRIRRGNFDAAHLEFEALHSSFWDGDLEASSIRSRRAGLTSACPYRRPSNRRSGA